MNHSATQMQSVTLTDEQRRQLEPFFNAVRAGNSVGAAFSIGAQIWPDGMVVKLFAGEQAKALAASLGSDATARSASADARMAKGARE